MPLTEMTVMIALFAALVVGFIQIIRLIQTAILHKTVRSCAKATDGPMRKQRTFSACRSAH